MHLLVLNESFVTGDDRAVVVEDSDDPPSGAPVIFGACPIAIWAAVELDGV